VSAPGSDFERDYERWTQLVDREATDNCVLSAEEQDFCRRFEAEHPACSQESAAYFALADLHAIPSDASRALVDRALQQLEAEEAERAVAEVRLLRRPRLPRWLALAGAACVIMLASFGLRSTRPIASESGALAAASDSAQPMAAQLARAELVYASGSVTVSGKIGAAGRALLTEDSTIETADGSACVLIDADINVCLAPQSRMRLAALATPARRIELDYGSLATRLATQPEGMSLTIRSAGVDSTAIGTAFSVERRVEHGDTGITDIRVSTTVLNGKVKVGRGGQFKLVNAHERALTSSDGPVVRSVSRSDEAPSWALLGQTVLWHDPVSATLEVRGGPAGAEVWLDEQRVGVSPLSSLVPVGEHRLALRMGGRELSSHALHARAGETIELDASQPAAAEPVEHPARRSRHARRLAAERRALAGGAAERRTALELRRAAPESAAERRATQAAAERRAGTEAAAERRAGTEAAAERRAEIEAAEASTPPAITADELLRLARHAMRSGRFAEAATQYEKLVAEFGGSDQAQTALMLLGQLRLTQLDDPRGALEALNGYLRNPGALEVEARVARIDALRKLQRSADEAIAIDDFLRRHPRSFEAAGLRNRRAALQGTPLQGAP
jgi:TolA-binding protein